VLSQAGFPAVGIMGKRGFDAEWVGRFGGVGEVVVALDPDATDAAWALAGTLREREYGGRVRVARMPGKPDDLIVKHGATAADIRGFLNLARLA